MPEAGRPDPASTTGNPVIILVRPQLGENVGTAARAMLNFGLDELRLVNPRFGWPNAKAVNAASGATAVLNHLRIFAGVDEAIGDLGFVYATTARPREMRKPVVTAEKAAVEARAAIEAGTRVGLMFGPERTGLANDETVLADAFVTVPLNPDFSSLNLAQAVLLLAYEWHKSGDRTAPRRPGLQGQHPAEKAELRGLLDHLSAELERKGFFKSPDSHLRIVQTLESTFARAGFTDTEVRLLRGVVKELSRERGGGG